MGKTIDRPTEQVVEQVLSITVTRVFDAPRSLVFEAWTEPKRLMRWWGRRGFTTPICTIDLRPGGSYHVCVRSSDGRDFCSKGTYREVIEPQRIVSVDSFADAEGIPVSPERYGLSPEWPEETRTEVIFAEQMGKTTITVQYSPIPPGPERDACLEGWEQSLNRLGDYLAKETRRPLSKAARKKPTKPNTMKAAAIDRFGGIETIRHQTLRAPEVGPDEILVRIESAGVGVWDPFEREGGFAKMSKTEPQFPYVLGSDGAGIVAEVGENVTRFKKGDRVYGYSLAGPKGGFYAEYAAIKEDSASLIPENVTIEQAGAMPVVAMTALQGLDRALNLKAGESVMIFGASGGIGHIAIQLAKRMGARVFAVASHEDGVKLARQLGADIAVDGHKDDIVAAARKFAPAGLDAALVTAGGEAVDKALTAMREGGRVAYPHGVRPEPKAPEGVDVQAYEGTPDAQAIEKLNRLIGSGPFQVHIARAFPLERAADAHQMLDTHYLGKIILRCK